MNDNSSQHSRADVQFSLASLLEFSALCAILSALFRISGIAACIFLMGMALALGARQGLLAIAMFALAILAAGAQSVPDQFRQVIQRQLSVTIIAALLSTWYVLRRRLARSRKAENLANGTESQDYAVKGD